MATATSPTPTSLLGASAAVLADPLSSAVAPNRRPVRSYLGRTVLYVIAIVLAAIFMFPFLFTVLSSLKSIPEIHALPPIIVPAVPQWHNYVDVFTIPGVPYARFYLNSFVIAVLVVSGTVITSCAAAYGFARFKWWGRDFFFIVLLSTLVLPEEIVLIPKFLLFNNVPRALIGQTLINTWWPLILPAWFGGGAFNVFLLRQFFMQIPKELDEAAYIDGANSWQILWHVILPLSRPALATVAIFSFLATW